MMNEERKKSRLRRGMCLHMPGLPRAGQAKTTAAALFGLFIPQAFQAAQASGRFFIGQFGDSRMT
jgi:hypothetical protein